ncbi:tyrosine-type recombinase/integrase (plasmid) [Cupriavidus necator]|nr:tyrosine-type recombinase/integrase [Cupriavidus necator]
MLIAHAERYLALRQALGFKLREVSMNIRAFARFATARGDTHVRVSTAVDWATEGSSPNVRYIRLRDVAHFGRFLHAEDPAHEVPANLFHFTKRRRLPYIYAPEELAQLIEAANHLRPTYPLRREGYATMFGLIAATGLRVSEALDLRLGDVMPDGILRIRHAKLGKSRLVPLHPTAATALNRFLEARCQLAMTDDHVFLSAGGRRIASSTMGSTFHQVTRLAGIASARTRQPRLVDLRHSFATRALEQCSTQREAVARHFVALTTYMGHTDIANTYWYLEATPELLTDIAAAAEALIAREDI